MLSNDNIKTFKDLAAKKHSLLHIVRFLLVINNSSLKEIAEDAEVDRSTPTKVLQGQFNNKRVRGALCLKLGFDPVKEYSRITTQ